MVRFRACVTVLLALASMAAVGAVAPAVFQAVELVSPRALQAALPSVAGWEKSDVSSGRASLPVPIAEAKATYDKDEAEVEVKIIDSANNQTILAPLTGAIGSGVSQAGRGKSQKSTTIGGFPCWEEWDGGERHGEINVLVARRIIVTVTGDDIAGIAVLREFAEKTGLKQLAALVEVK